RQAVVLLKSLNNIDTIGRITRLKIRQGIFHKEISQDFWKCTVAEMGKTRWRGNITCNIVERCKQFEVFLNTDEQGWQIKDTGSMIEDLIPPKVFEKTERRILKREYQLGHKNPIYLPVQLKKSKTDKRYKPWIVLKDQDLTASIISRVLDATGEDTYFEHWLTEPGHNTGLLHRCTGCSINIANEANQCVGKKSITQNFHQVKSIVKKKNKWSILIPAPWFFTPTVLEQGIEESFVELQPIKNVDITFIKSQHFKPKVE
ncbi:1940_t:CDS:2, partial [Dentiscutata heterogama]